MAEFVGLLMILGLIVAVFGGSLLIGCVFVWANRDEDMLFPFAWLTTAAACVILSIKLLQNCGYLL